MRSLVLFVFLLTALVAGQDTSQPEVKPATQQPAVVQPSQTAPFITTSAVEAAQFDLATKENAKYVAEAKRLLKRGVKLGQELEAIRQRLQELNTKIVSVQKARQ